MEAQVGDEIIVESGKIGGPRRRGEVLEVRGEPGHQHFVVRWDDGHETVFFPGPDARVQHLAKPGPAKSGNRKASSRKKGS
ncbi:MAG: DUF1918 domain-containing protein [Acidimicrobiia bacterium]|nr:DUF1918 domain-containing protein [Acidimicrobiia bacterium]